MNTFETLYKGAFQNVYSRSDKAEPTPRAAQQYVEEFYISFPDTVPSTTTSLSDEGEVLPHDFCSKIARTMNGGLSLDK